MWLDLLRAVGILLVALVAGLAFAHVLESPAKMAYSPQLYIELQNTLYVHWGPPNIGGFLEPIAIASTGLLAIFLKLHRLPSGFTLAAFVCLFLAFPVIFFWLVAPANADFRAASGRAIPTNWADLRSSWEMGHAIRFGFQFVALASLVVSLMILKGGKK